MSLRYEYTVKDFTCLECGEFSDEVTNMTSDFEDTTITALCCDTEFWLYDLQMEGFEVIEKVHGGEPAVW